MKRGQYRAWKMIRQARQSLRRNLPSRPLTPTPTQHNNPHINDAPWTDAGIVVLRAPVPDIHSGIGDGDGRLDPYPISTCLSPGRSQRRSWLDRGCCLDGGVWWYGTLGSRRYGNIEVPDPTLYPLTRGIYTRAPEHPEHPEHTDFRNTVQH